MLKVFRDELSHNFQSMVPIFERMEYARWWTDSLKQKYPLVTKYWEAIQKREGYIASKPEPAMHNKLVKIGQTRTSKTCVY